MTDYAKRLDAIRDKWCWMPGMRFMYLGEFGKLFGQHVTDMDDGVDRGMGGKLRTDCKWVDSAECVPDLHDPATKGCLVVQVREATYDPDWCPRKNVFNEWYDPLELDKDREVILYGTEEECILAALEAM